MSTTLGHLIQTKVCSKDIGLIKIAAAARGLTVAGLLRDAIRAYIGDPDARRPSLDERVSSLEHEVATLKETGRR